MAVLNSCVPYQENVKAIRFYETHGFAVTDQAVCEHTGCAELAMAWKKSPNKARRRRNLRKLIYPLVKQLLISAGKQGEVVGLVIISLFSVWIYFRLWYI